MYSACKPVDLYEHRSTDIMTRITTVGHLGGEFNIKLRVQGNCGGSLLEALARPIKERDVGLSTIQPVNASDAGKKKNEKGKKKDKEDAAKANQEYGIAFGSARPGVATNASKNVHARPSREFEANAEKNKHDRIRLEESKDFEIHPNYTEGLKQAFAFFKSIAMGAIRRIKWDNLCILLVAYSLINIFPVCVSAADVELKPLKDPIKDHVTSGIPSDVRDTVNINDDKPTKCRTVLIYRPGQPVKLPISNGVKRVDIWRNRDDCGFIDVESCNVVIHCDINVTCRYIFGSPLITILNPEAAEEYSFVCKNPKPNTLTCTEVEVFQVAMKDKPFTLHGGPHINHILQLDEYGTFRDGYINISYKHVESYSGRSYTLNRTDKAFDVTLQNISDHEETNILLFYGNTYERVKITSTYPYEKRSSDINGTGVKQPQTWSIFDIILFAISIFLLLVFVISQLVWMYIIRSKYSHKGYHSPDQNQRVSNATWV